MTLLSDVDKNVNEIMDLIINGNTVFDGLIKMIEAADADLNFDIVMAHPEKIIGEEGVVELPLKQAIISVYDSEEAEPGQFFKHHKLPKGGKGYGWQKETFIRWDVWARTPPESRSIADVLRKQLMKAADELWGGYRIGLTIGRTYDIPRGHWEEVKSPISIYHKYIETSIRTFEQVKGV